MNIVKHLPYRLTTLIRTVTPALGKHIHKCYSQEGEDRLIERIIGHTSHGFYVDVGAHHPIRLSNTHMLYKRGWRGINIDAMPGSMMPFKIWRSHDINIEAAIANGAHAVTFHSFKEPVYNTADPQIATARRERLHEADTTSNTFNMTTVTLKSILDKYLPENTSIDLLSVDVEGLDLEVLRSNDWTRYRPKFVFVEILGQTLDSIHETPTYEFLKKHGYVGLSKLLHSVLFVEESCMAAIMKS